MKTTEYPINKILLAEIEKNRKHRLSPFMVMVFEVVFNKKNRYELKGE